MLDYVIAKVSPVIESYGAWGVFLISIIEEIIAPIPSSLTLAMAGFFLLPVDVGFAELLAPLFLKVVIPAAAGLTIGSFFMYSIAYFGGKAALLKWGRRMGVSWESVEKVNEKFRGSRSDEVVIFALRGFPLVPNIAISAFCGLIRYPVRNFVIVTFLGTMVRAIIMGILGQLAGEAYVEYAAEISAISNYVFAAIILSVLAYLAYHFYLARRPKVPL